jgi:cystathionine beta-synthase
MLYENITDIIGLTPLVRAKFVSVPCYAKLEFFNPGCSIKDRAAWHMIRMAEQRGDLKPGGTIIEASSGNQGISASYIGASRGYRVIITVSEKVSIEKRATLEAYGATVIVCPATTLLTDQQSYHSTALSLQKTIPNSIMLNQYFNKDNLNAHYVSLGPDIWKQTEGKITHFIAGAGSGGTVSGAGRYLKEQNPHIRVIAVDTATSYRTTKGNPRPYVIEGLGVDYDTPLLDLSVVDDFISVNDDNAIEMLKIMARSHGLLVGPASGAVAYATRELSRTLSPNSLVVMLFGDSGRSYLTKQFFANRSENCTTLDALQSCSHRENPVMHLHGAQVADIMQDLRQDESCLAPSHATSLEDIHNH